MKVPKTHPRYKSLLQREKIIKGLEEGFVAKAGLIAQGRGEAFDYLIGETTTKEAKIATIAGVSMLLSAKNPVISVNGNVAALCPKEIVELSKVLNAKLEVNLFYRTEKRANLIKKILLKHGAKEVYGVEKENRVKLKNLNSKRGIVDKKGIYMADVVFVPLEDGDRTEALKKLGKKVVTVDLNPLSRTAKNADITIVDNIIRVVPNMIKIAKEKKIIRTD